jgi:hypothetical protein
MRPPCLTAPLTTAVACLALACADPAAPANSTPESGSTLVHDPPWHERVDASATYSEGFDFLFSTAGAFGTPGGPPWPAHQPTPWKPTDFDVAIHSRDESTWYQPETFRAMHGTDCSPYQTPEPANAVRHGDLGTHDAVTYDDLNYRCRNHMMTAIKATGYGSIYVTPNAMVDFGAREASIKFALSTLRTSGNDWVDIWITPFADNLTHPIDARLGFTTDLQGVPRTGIHIRMVPGQQRLSRFDAYYVNNHVEMMLPVINTNGYESILTPVSTRRDTFELTISRNRVRFGMKKIASPDGPARSIDWVDVPLSLPWTRGVVQFGHHSMNPQLGGGSAGTWHWDDIKIAPAIPFTTIAPKLDGGTRRRYVDAATAETPVEFERAAPADAYLRFSAFGPNLQFSVDGGATWTNARRQPASLDRADRFRSYWTPIPEGTSSVLIRRAAGTGPWMVRDLGIWSPNP